MLLCPLRCRATNGPDARSARLAQELPVAWPSDPWTALLESLVGEPLQIERRLDRGAVAIVSRFRDEPLP
jgi:hypothetical protein